MVAVLCCHCGSERLRKNGLSALNKQRYHCANCGRRSTENPDPGLTPEKEAEVLRLLNERMSQRGIARALKMSRNSVVAIVKKTMKSAISNGDQDNPLR